MCKGMYSSRRSERYGGAVQVIYAVADCSNPVFYSALLYNMYPHA